MAPAIAVSASLTHVDVRYNSIIGDGASQLSVAVLGNTAIEVFNEVPIKEMRADSFTELDLDEKGIGVAGGMVVAGLIPVMTSVTSVSLLANRFDDETVAMLLQLKEEKPNLTTLCGLKPDQAEADFQYWGLTPQDAKLLAPEILVHASVTSVRSPAHRTPPICSPLSLN